MILKTKVLTAAFALLFILTSCREDDSHPITWKYWTDAAKLHLLKFYNDGSVVDLYNIEKTNKNIFVADEDGFIIYRKTILPHDTLAGKILLVNSEKLVVKFENRNNIDTFYRAGRNEKFVGKWIPGVEKNTSDTLYLMNSEISDSYKIDEEGRKSLFRYKLINDTIVEFDYFETGGKVQYYYLLSQDAKLLRFELGKQTISLKRK